MRIEHTTPDWPPGFSSFLAAKLISGIADAYIPWLHLHPLPLLYKSGVVYREEPNHGSGDEEFANPWTTHARGWGDCDDLLAWRLMELRARGERKARPAFEWRGNDIHVLVQRASGKLEDPSLILGGGVR